MQQSAEQSTKQSSMSHLICSRSSAQTVTFIARCFELKRGSVNSRIYPHLDQTEQSRPHKHWQADTPLCSLAHLASQVSSRIKQLSSSHHPRPSMETSTCRTCWLDDVSGNLPSQRSLEMLVTAALSVVERPRSGLFVRFVAPVVEQIGKRHLASWHAEMNNLTFGWFHADERGNRMAQVQVYMMSHYSSTIMALLEHLIANPPRCTRAASPVPLDGTPSLQRRRPRSQTLTDLTMTTKLCNNTAWQNAGHPCLPPTCAVQQSQAKHILYTDHCSRLSTTSTTQHFEH